MFIYTNPNQNAIEQEWQDALNAINVQSNLTLAAALADQEARAAYYRSIPPNVHNAPSFEDWKAQQPAKSDPSPAPKAPPPSYEPPPTLQQPASIQQHHRNDELATYDDQIEQAIKAGNLAAVTALTIAKKEAERDE